jgi:hypothetical protein
MPLVSPWLLCIWGGVPATFPLGFRLSQLVRTTDGRSSSSTQPRTPKSNLQRDQWLWASLDPTAHAVSRFFRSGIQNARLKPLVAPFPDPRYVNSHMRSTVPVDLDLTVTIPPELKVVERHSVLIPSLFHGIQRLTGLRHFFLKQFHRPFQLLKLL